MNSPVRKYFPDPNFALPGGIVAAGIGLNNETLLEAYGLGIFPWPHEDYPMLWFSPEQRGILEFKDFHLSQSMKKNFKKMDWSLRWNTAFEQTIEGCADMKRAQQKGTWINDELFSAYLEFHKAGYAHSIECWEGEDLIGGLYGVCVKGVFSGESMFHKKSYASSYCLAGCIQYLGSLGLSWMDIQMVTPHLEKMGGKYIARKDYLSLLKKSQKENLKADFAGSFKLKL